MNSTTISALGFAILHGLIFNDLRKPTVFVHSIMDNSAQDGLMSIGNSKRVRDYSPERREWLKKKTNKQTNKQKTTTNKQNKKHPTYLKLQLRTHETKKHSNLYLAASYQCPEKIVCFFITVNKTFIKRPLPHPCYSNKYLFVGI